MNSPWQSLWSKLRGALGRSASAPSARSGSNGHAARGGAAPAGPSSSSVPGTAATPPAGARPLERSVSVVIPALNEAARIASVVRHARDDPATAEVIVIDDSSIDDTARLAAAAGARVVRSTMLGKGASMADGVREAQHEIVVFLDGDLAGLRAGLVGALAAPLAEGRADFVKARFGRSGGRVTELTARPMLRVFFPELAGFAQPLGGLIAARRPLLAALRFEDGYGVDIGLLIDAARAGARLAEVDIGSLEHDPQPLGDLSGMAVEVSHVIYDRARAAGRLNVDQIGRMFEEQRQAAAAVESALARRRGRHRVLLLDLDGTLLEERFALHMARATGREPALRAVLEHAEGPDVGAGDLARARAAAALFRFVHQNEFERVAREVPLRAGVVECVHRWRSAGFMVGVVSDDWFIGAEILRRRVFADFALAHTLVFEAGVCNGDLRTNPAFLAPGATGPLDKGHVVNRLREDLDGRTGGEPLEVWAVGDGDDDFALLRLADRGFVVGPGLAAQRLPPHVQRVADLLAIEPGVAAPA